MMNKIRKGKMIYCRENAMTTADVFVLLERNYSHAYDTTERT
jgi:hypothetical protein